jgi:hypothetical protein
VPTTIAWPPGVDHEVTLQRLRTGVIQGDLLGAPSFDRELCLRLLFQALLQMRGRDRGSEESVAGSFDETSRSHRRYRAGFGGVLGTKGVARASMSMLRSIVQSGCGNWVGNSLAAKVRSL